MSVLQDGNPSDIMVFQTSEEARLGGYKTPVHVPIHYGRLKIYRNGTRGGSERLRLKFYTDIDCSKSYASSEWVDLDDVHEEIGDFDTGSYWRGWIRLSFSTPVFFNKNFFYYAAIETSNYTRNADMFYLACEMDGTYNTYGSGNTPTVARLELYGARLLDLL